MWWTVWLILAGVLAALNDGPRRRALLTICTALLVVQIFKFLPVGDLIWLCFAASWVTVGGMILTTSPKSSTLAIISAACYAIGEWMGFDFAAGSNHMWESPLFYADMALVASILVLGGSDAWRYIRRSVEKLATHSSPSYGHSSSLKGHLQSPSQSSTSKKRFATAESDGGRNA